MAWGWQRETIELHCGSQAERPIGRDQRPGWGVTSTARVRITISDGESLTLIREGCGAGHGIDVVLVQAHESALKQAETDAMKRALMTFGNPFDLGLYDKEQRQVSGGTGSGPARACGSIRLSGNGGYGHRPSAVPGREQREAKPEPGDASSPAAFPDGPVLAPLDPQTIQRLHATLRRLSGRRWWRSPPTSASGSRCPGGPSIADRITQKRHHNRIQAWLVQLRTSRSRAATVL